MNDIIDKTKKVCPLCKKRYPEINNYCSRDGMPLQIFTEKTDFSKPELARVTAALECPR